MFLRGKVREGGSPFCTVSPRVLRGMGGMVQSRDKNGMRGFEGESISGEWNTGVRVC